MWGGLGGKGSRGSLAGKDAGGGAGLEAVNSPLTGEGTLLSPLAIPAATSSTPGHMTAAQAALLTELEAAQGLRQLLIAEALTDLGLTATPERLIFWMHVFAEQGLNGLTVSGTPTAILGSAQFLRLTETNGTTRYQASPVTTATGQGLMAIGANGASDREWWTKGRVRAQAMPNGNGDVVGFGFFSTIPEAVVQASNSASATKFSAAGGTGGSIVDNSSVVYTDGAFHTVKLWRAGGVTSLSVDGNTAVTGNTRPFDPGAPNPAYLSSGSSSNSVGDYVWAAFAAELEV